MKKGFTLVELLVTILIICTLLAITYPMYHHYLIRSHRADGQSALLDLAARMENYFADHQTYVGATLGDSSDKDIRNSTESPQGWYTLSITYQTINAFTLQATPVGSQAENDTACQSLTVNQAGRKRIEAGPAGMPLESAEYCWQ